MFIINSINGSVQLLGAPDFLRNNGPPWTDNLLDPGPSWGDGGTTTNQNWESQPGGIYGSFVVPWIRPVPVRPSYVLRSPGNARADERCIRDNHLQSRRLERMHSPSTIRNPIFNPRVNRRDDHREGPFDK